MEFRIKISGKKAIILTSIFLLILLGFMILTQIKFPIYSWDYHGVKLKFRVNLREAEKIPIYPNESAVKEEILNNFVENITIVFKSENEATNAHYAVEVFEIAYKLTLAYKMKFSYIPNFNVMNVTSYENIKGTKENPVIALIHPMYSNETSVKLEDNVIYIQGDNSKSLAEQLRNFDLAVTKFLMVVLDIKDLT